MCCPLPLGGEFRARVISIRTALVKQLLVEVDKIAPVKAQGLEK